MSQPEVNLPNCRRLGSVWAIPSHDGWYVAMPIPTILGNAWVLEKFWQTDRCPSSEEDSTCAKDGTPPQAS